MRSGAIPAGTKSDVTETNRCAIVGGGLAGLCAYATLRHGGLTPAEIAVFGTDPDPAAQWRRRAGAIRQRTMRSESDGHCAPRSFPGLAVRAARRELNPLPLVQTLFDRFHPTVDAFLDHVAELRASSGWDESFRRRTVRRLRAAVGGFEVDDAGRFQHVLVATGHPGLHFPEGAADDPRAVHAYEPHDYADEVEIVGAGMAAATEWLNALAAGSKVISVRRREPERRPLNLPRQFFSRRGLAAFHRSRPEERADFLRRCSAPSYPPGRAWDDPLGEASRRGRFRVSSGLNGSAQIIYATGFKRGYREDELLAALAQDHDLETAGTWIVLESDSTVPMLTDSERTLSLAGVAGQWAFPAADTLVGAKYAARGFLDRVLTCRSR
jgi:cation diffusion facilitator CzcD-associated flavoprotein CzcO